MKPAKTRRSTKPRLTQRAIKQLALVSALFFLIAAAISLYLAWRDLYSGAPNVEVIT